jgi:hypothetical protein
VGTVAVKCHGGYNAAVQRLLQWLGGYPTATAIVGGVGSAFCGIGLSQSWGHWILVLWVLGIALAIALPASTAKRNRLQQGQRAAQNCIRNLLAACGSAYGHADRHVRANIMLAKDGRRRVQAETAFNMDSDSDCDLEIDDSAGVSGEAFVQRATTYGDLAILLHPGGPTWGLRPAEKAKVRRDLKSILSAPIFDPDDAEGPLLGTLQVDSDLTFEQMEFDKPERRAVAERFADVVALLLKAGR